MKKLRILIDLDGIVCDTYPYWLDHIFFHTGIRAGVEDLTQWDISKCPPLTNVPAEVINSRLQDPGFYLGIKPILGAQEYIKRLHDEGHEIYFVTARHGDTSMPETIQWMAIHFPWIITDKQVNFVYDKHIIRGDVLIDDKAQTLIRYGEEYPFATLMAIEYPYNRHTAEEGVLLVPRDRLAWERLYKHITELAGLDTSSQ